jgi:hypothetical protein
MNAYVQFSDSTQSKIMAASTLAAVDAISWEAA